MPKDMRRVRRDSDGSLWPYHVVTAAKKGFTAGRLDENGKFISASAPPAMVSVSAPASVSAPEALESIANDVEDANDEDAEEEEQVYDD